MSKCQNWRLNELQLKWEDHAERRTKEKIIENKNNYCNFSYNEGDSPIIKQFHPDIDEIMKTINCYFCLEHPDKVLTIGHLHEHGL